MMTMKIKLLTARTHWISPFSAEAEKEAEVCQTDGSDEGPTHVKTVRVAERAVTGRGREGCGVRAIVVKPSSWGSWSDVGGACLLFLEEGQS